MSERRTAFFVSDRTGITAEMLGHSLLTQFESVRFQQSRCLSSTRWTALKS